MKTQIKFLILCIGLVCGITFFGISVTTLFLRSNTLDAVVFSNEDAVAYQNQKTNYQWKKSLQMFPYPETTPDFVPEKESYISCLSNHSEAEKNENKKIHGQGALQELL